ILAMQSDAAAAEAAIGTAKSAIMPTLDLELSANHRDRIVGTSAANTNYKAMLVFRMSLYNGGINAARIKEAGYRAEEAQNMVEATRINVEREIRLA
ncbi:MAG: TolC family protein, partial [Nitratireductor sp.]|nr:TolC family protein [Nitratireductor sp.]